MSEWSTYRLTDFLMFSPQAYWRLVARYNEAWWPAQGLGAAACGALLWVVLRGASGGRARAASAVLAVAWAFTGWAFHRQRYAEIFLGAPWAAAAFGIQAALLATAAMLPAAPHREPRPAAGAAGAALVLLALLFPLLALVQGRGWPGAEVFGLLPDPTALATLGVLLAGAWPVGWRLALAIVPVLSLLLGLATRALIA